MSIIQKIVISISILFLFGCYSGIDSYESLKMAKEEAGTELVVRMSSNNEKDIYCVIDKDGKVRQLWYSAMFKFRTPKLEHDIVMFEIKNFEKTMIIKREDAEVNE